MIEEIRAKNEEERQARIAAKEDAPNADGNGEEFTGFD
jgi:hypothetical protein